MNDLDVLTKIVIPIATFGLGILAAFLTQQYWKRKDVTAESAKSVADLTADWYNQLDQLRNSLKADAIRADPLKAAQIVDAYIQNRLILPKLLYHLAVLRERKAYPELVDQAERFLSVVTAPKYPAIMLRLLDRGFSLECTNLTSENPTDPEAYKKFVRILRELDDRQQDIARKAGR